MTFTCGAYVHAGVQVERSGYAPNRLTIRTARAERKPTKEISMFLTPFVILLVVWLLGFFAFHVAGGLTHRHVWPLACLSKYAGCPGGDHFCCFRNILGRGRRRAASGAARDIQQCRYEVTVNNESLENLVVPLGPGCSSAKTL